MNFQEQIASKSDQELLDIYINSDDYQKEFVDQTFQELNKRGIPTDKYKVEKENKARLTRELMTQGRRGNEVYIVLGFISAVLGGLFGLIAGYVYSQSKQNDPSGESYYVYDKKTRESGQLMMIVGTVALIATIIWRFS